ncbi:MAG: hypothetical protein IPP77_05740 [Bacteroidetes bacterium]|nr:hypothetical protein [Bacteroidota bacterium]
MSQSSLQVLIGVLSILVVLITVFLKKSHDELRDVKSKLSEKKFDTYNEILAVLFDIVKQQQKLTTISEDETLSRLMNVKRDLMLYGNDKIIRKFFEWEENQLKVGYRLWNWAELAALARRDMAYQSTSITADDILRSLFRNRHEYLEFKEEFILKK